MKITTADDWANAEAAGMLLGLAAVAIWILGGWVARLLTGRPDAKGKRHG